MTEPGARYRLLALMAVMLLMAALASTMAPPSSALPGSDPPVAVKIQNFAFSPATITVVIGVNNTVTWTNMDSVTHTVTADDGSFGSGDLSNGQTYTHTFTAPGSFGYHCSIHTYMKGNVVVKGSGSTTTSATASSTASTTTSATTSASSSSSPAVTTSSTTSPGSSSGVPVFPFQGVLLTIVTLALAASYFVVRRNVRGRSPMQPAQG